jgi:hypothetical protein
MTWLDKLLGKQRERERDLDREHAEDLQALDELRKASVTVHERTERLERELLRVNAELRRQNG